MITNQEINAVKLSATKKDFYQIWNELLDTAGKLSERWDPASTNESDPGIVLLKVLTAVADKLNYSIDTNILEAFMPTAAQEESMRKLTEMLGYSMKYYRSATTDVTISYAKTESAPLTGPVHIDRFTNIKDADDTVNYVTLKAIDLFNDNATKSVPCIEGELVTCETDNDNIISISLLDDNNRYYMPETQIAENGIFVTNVNDNLNSPQESDEWEKVDNLNAKGLGEDGKYYKFGFDSKEGLPYIQFPDNISSLIEDGLRIKYIRTHGASGNVSVRTLSKMETPSSWDTTSEDAAYNVDNYNIYNSAAAKNGADKESLDDAYSNYKKTIGTFDTLVTCRDYINKIYQMTSDDNSNVNLVSNVIVSDIRDDINKAVTLCTFGNYGIEYVNQARSFDYLNSVGEESTFPSRPEDEVIQGYDIGHIIKVGPNAKGYYEYYQCEYDTATSKKKLTKINTEKLSHFDLVLYPFKNVYGLNNQKEYVNSFKYTDENLLDIKAGLEESKTISHRFVTPEDFDLACIKNYYKLNAKIITTRKVNYTEQTAILKNIYAALYKNFNLRKVDFGEEIDYDEILSVIKAADARIKTVTMEEPTLVTKYCTASGNEYGTSDDTVRNDETSAGNAYYNRLVLNNVLAGRIPLFNYSEDFKPEYTEKQYPGNEYAIVYPEGQKKIKKITSDFTIKYDADFEPVTLNENEIVQFSFPNLKTVLTYPAYVNYFLKLNTDNTNNAYRAAPATLRSLGNFLDLEESERSDAGVPLKFDGNEIGSNYKELWDLAVDQLKDNIINVRIANDDDFAAKKSKYRALFTKSADASSYIKVGDKDEYAAGTEYYVLNMDSNNFSSWKEFIKKFSLGDNSMNGLYKLGVSVDDQAIGEGITVNHQKATLIKSYQGVIDPFDTLYVQQLHAESYLDSDDEAQRYTANGLGQNKTVSQIVAGTDYQLKQGEYLCINYTPSSTENSNSSAVVNKVYPAGTIIRASKGLIDSKDYRGLGHNYTKTDKAGFDFTAELGKIGVAEEVNGMFTLGTNEQIEIRDFVQVKLDKQATNIYWNLNNEQEQDGKIYFPWNDQGVYTLQDNEYFYYTDKDRQTLVYYGAGTKLTKGRNTPEIYKSVKDNQITAEEIASEGLTAAISWRAYNFSGTDAAVTIQEYQYVNLIKGDKLKSISLAEAANTAVDRIDGTERDCSAASYESGAAENNSGTLPAHELRDSNGQPIRWKVRTKLEINMGPNKVQRLHRTENTADKLRLIYTDNSFKDIQPALMAGSSTSYDTLSLKSSVLMQSSSGKVNTTVQTYNSETDQIDTDYPCRIKLFKEERVTDYNGTPLTTGNFGNGLCTKIALEQTTNSKPFTKLNLIVPEGHFGMIMFYYIKSSTAGADDNTVPSISTDGNLDCLSIYNADTEEHPSIPLKEGINVVKISKSCTLNIGSGTGTMIFSSLDIIPTGDKGINPKLAYKKTSDRSIEQQILADIKKLDPSNKFYYNAPMNNETLIDLNPEDPSDTLADPRAWYLYNNVNNKFVGSEIDANYLTTGIAIAKSSKLS